MAKEINVKSSTIERGLEIATKFLDVLIIPSISFLRSTELSFGFTHHETSEHFLLITLHL